MIRVGKAMPHVLMIFLDGVGIGKKNASINPFFSVEMKSLEKCESENQGNVVP